MSEEMRIVSTTEVANTMPDGLLFDIHGRMSKSSFTEYKGRSDVQRMLNVIENNMLNAIVPAGGMVSLLRSHEAMDRFFIRPVNEGAGESEKSARRTRFEGTLIPDSVVQDVYEKRHQISDLRLSLEATGMEGGEVTKDFCRNYIAKEAQRIRARAAALSNKIVNGAIAIKV
jgi:hypothetical protein